MSPCGKIMSRTGHLYGATYVGYLFTNCAFLVSSDTFYTATRLTVGGSVGIPAASFVITRRLYKISRIHGVATTKEEVSVLTHRPAASLIDPFL